MLNDWSGQSWAILIALPPLMVAAVHGLHVGLLRRPLAERSVAVLSCAGVAGSLIASLFAFGQLLTREDGSPIVESLFSWVGLGVGQRAFNTDLSFRLDSLSVVFCLAIGTVGLLIHLFAIEAMRHDERDDRGYQRFFCFSNLLVAGMLVLVLADNLPLFFLGWECVGLSSWLLIGFWYTDEGHVRSGVAALTIDHIGSSSLLFGSILLFWSLADGGSPTTSLHGVTTGLSLLTNSAFALPSALGGANLTLASAIGAFLFVAALVRSAQLPLAFWLSDAEGCPLPAAALVQSVTGVASGAYLLIRFSFLYEASPEISLIIAWTGASTALLAALFACAQTDVARLFSWSTSSQLGFVLLAVGTQAYSAAVFHLLMHAVFKTTVMLAVAVVVVALDQERDLRRMGGIGSRFPQTRMALWLGVLALVGAPLFSGFFSRDRVLLASWTSQPAGTAHPLYWIALLAVAVSAFHGLRLIQLVFYGATSLPIDQQRELHDPGPLMSRSLGALAVLSILASLVGPPQIWGDLLGVPDSDSLQHFLARVLPSGVLMGVSPSAQWAITGSGLVATALGALLVFVLYGWRPRWRERLVESSGWLLRPLERGLSLGPLSRSLVAVPLSRGGEKLLGRALDERLIDGVLVMGTVRAARAIAGGLLRRLHEGALSAQIALLALGALLLSAYLLWCQGGAT